MTTEKVSPAEQTNAVPDGARSGLPQAEEPTTADGAVLGATSIIEREEQRTRAAIARALADLGYEAASQRPIDLRALPFAGTWGAASTVARALAGEIVTQELEQSGALEGLSKKEAKRKVNELTPAKAQEIAEAIAAKLLADETLSLTKVEAVNGYVNVYFDASAMAIRLISEVLNAADDYGQGAPQSEVVMIEHSQPNTHKAFHVGHLRNTSLGVALSHIISKAGYRVLDATYIGDIGRHVIQCLWCYEQFYQGKEPADIEQRGRWLGEVYTESERRLRFGERVVNFLYLLAKEDVGLVASIDKLLKQLWKSLATDNGEDVAYLLHRMTQAVKIDPADLNDLNVIVAFWPIIGAHLRESIEHPKPLTLPESELPEQTMTPEERLAEWEELNEHIADWWPNTLRWQEQMREEWRRWTEHDPEFMALWKETREWSLIDFRRIFSELGAEFDVWFFESQVEDMGKEIVKELLEAGIAEISEGLPVVKIDEKLGLETETYRTLPILRSDGTSLYSTKDLALTKLKFDEYHVDRTLWVVDARQSLYFQQIRKVLELWGFEQAKKADHIVYEFVALPEGAISSRKGNAPLYDDVKEMVLKRAREIIAEKNPDLAPEVAEVVAWQVAIGSLKYAMLARDNNKVVIFDLEEALSFDGHAAPYIQYAHARACRILERAGVDANQILATLGDVRFTTMEPQELSLLQQIAAFPEWVQRAATEYRPTVICQYVYELAKTFNDFYHACPVLQSDEPYRSARLALVAATRQTLDNGLEVLGITAPEVM